VKTLDDKDYFLQVPANKKAWEDRKKQVRAQILAAGGLWPLPETKPILAKTTAIIDRDAYTVENVWFESRPGQIVTGNLYRPKDTTKSVKQGKIPAVLCPHGHWANGRFYETPDKNVEAELKSKAESRTEGAKYPLQARCAQLARMGCIVFHYDMVGYADNRPVAHQAGFGDPQAELWTLNWFGLQTFNSIRALDYVLSLEGVDPTRIGVTGASGGGTQTFILGAIDERPTADFPAVMVGTRMQGGCVCENASWLRVGTGNVEFAGMFAPKPMAMSGANDWTIAIEKEGLPELKQLYALYNKADLVYAKCWPEFGHNYNQVSRELMYNWFNKHLGLNQPEPVSEAPFQPIPPAQLAVFPKGSPLPQGILETGELRIRLTEEAKAHLATLAKEVKSGSTKRFEDWIDPLMTMAVGEWPLKEGKGVEAYGTLNLKRAEGGDIVRLIPLGEPTTLGGPMNLVVLEPAEFQAAKAGKPPEWVAQLGRGPEPIFLIEPFGLRKETEARTRLNNRFVGYTWGYNRPLVAERARDIQTALAWMYSKGPRPKIHARGKAAVPAALALAASPGKTQFASLDFQGFRFEDLKDLKDERFLPGAARWGGLGSLLARGLPRNKVLKGLEGTGADLWINTAP